MDYDISTVENCLNTLKTLTNCYYWEDIYERYKYTYSLYPDEIKQIIIEQNNIEIKVTADDFYFVLMHITTSANGCTEIKDKGIYDLEWVLKHDTELSRFLADNHISFDIQNKKMYVYNIAFDISNDSKNVGFKIFKDKDICGCFQINKDIPYGGYVHLRPEILFNIDNYIPQKNLCQKWCETHIPYIIKFRVPYSNMDIALMMSVKNDSEKEILNKLLGWAIDVFFYRDFHSDNIGILKRGVFVPPSDIISITEY